MKGSSSERARRREAQEIIAAYHQEQLRALLEHVREALTKLDAGELDEFEVDDLIHRYNRAAKQLWMFCGPTGSHVVTPPLPLRTCATAARSVTGGPRALPVGTSRDGRSVPAADQPQKMQGGRR